MKYFICTDVHGYYTYLQDALNNAGYDRANPNHTFVSLGDLFDRGPQPYKCLQFVLSLPEDRRILVRGNHEDLLEYTIQRNGFERHDYSNGTALTVANFLDYAPTDKASNNNSTQFICPENLKHFEPLNEYLHSLKRCFEVGELIFAHSWIPTTPIKTKSAKPWNDPKAEHCKYNPDWREADLKDFERSRWGYPLRKWYEHATEPDKTIICGHWWVGDAWEELEGMLSLRRLIEVTSYATNKTTTPLWLPGMIMMDANAAWSKTLNVLIIDTVKTDDLNGGTKEVIKSVQYVNNTDVRTPMPLQEISIKKM